MATTQTTPADQLKPEYGKAEVIALKFAEPKLFEGTFGPRALFTLADDRRMWLDAEDGSEIVRDMREKGIGAGDQFRLTKIRHPRGGGHSFRVEALEQAPAWVTDNGTAPASRTWHAPAPEQCEERRPPAREDRSATPLADALEQSVALAREHGAAAFTEGRPAAAIARTAPPSPAPETPAGSASHQLMSCFMAAIDAIAEAQAYADRKQLKVTFTSEDVRATAISAYIQHERAMLAAPRGY